MDYTLLQNESKSIRIVHKCIVINKLIKKNIMIDQSYKDPNRKDKKVYFTSLKFDKDLFTKVEPILVQLANQKHNAEQIIKIVQKFAQLSHANRSYTGKSYQKYSFRTLYRKYKTQLVDIYSQIAKFILSTDIQDIQLMLTDKSNVQYIKKSNILHILCLMSMMLVPVQHYEKDQNLESKFHHIKHFGFIFSEIQFKTIGVIEYLKIELKQQENKKQNDLEQILSIQRMILLEKYQDLDEFYKEIIQEFGAKPLSTYKLKIQQNNRNIEQFYKELKVDFANKYIGGGSLTHGSVQQQIMFAIHPQLYVTMLLCQRMKDHEVLIFNGFRKYFETEGYGYNVKLIGFNNYKYQYSKVWITKDKKNYNIAREYIVAIDAVNFNFSNDNQYSKQMILRELAKAYLGFAASQPSLQWIAAGNWGCGVFGGNIQLKIIIQWLAASMAKKSLRYCPFGSRQSVYDEDLLNKLAKKDIKTVLKLLLKCASEFHELNREKKYNLRSRQIRNKITFYELFHKYMDK